MSGARLLVTEAWSSIRQNLSTTVAATMTVLIGMVLLGVFIALGTWVLSWSNHIQKELQVNVYFASNATRAQEQAVGVKLRHDSRVKKLTYVSKAQAQAKMRKEFPDLYKTPLPNNPLPDAWVVTPTQAKYTPILGQKIQRAHLAGVDAVHWGSATAKRVLTIAEVIWIVFLVAVVLLVVASTLLIANTIRLSIFARRREIEVMKLVGATNWFVRGPFMLEGLVCGVAGSVLAVVLLVLGKTIALPSILPHIGGGSSDVHALPFTFNALLLVAAGLLLGAAGSGLTLRRFLQV
ncbi:MAG TPA: permease-like cell division protein FtsX [Gaiellaceae bacterium]|jgi:cell division transport system permease protein|nr:permease-like cell division protein FtsX [Gaiellaceae bacterium]